MACHPELQLSCRFWRVPGYGSLWHPGRGWIALPRSINGIHISSILSFLRAKSPGEVFFWAFISGCTEEQKAEWLTCEAIMKAENMMSVPHDDSLYYGSYKMMYFRPGDSMHVLRASEINLSSELLNIGSEVDLNKVHCMPSMAYFMECLLKKAREIDLSKELHLLARIVQALSNMHDQLSAMLFIVPSFASLIFTRPIIEITGLLSELDQLILQRGKRRNSVLILPANVCICDITRDEEFFTWVLGNLAAGVAIHCINEAAILIERQVDEKRQTCQQRLLSKIHADIELDDFRRYKVDAAKAEGDRLRNEFLERAELKPPQVLRMIDCIATCNEGRVVLKDWKDCEQAWGYSAISHTYGQDVYQVFNCTCASICKTATKPRCSPDRCPHDPIAPNAAHTATQTRVVKEILNMCGTLCDARVRYAWHDGVCIAQHDEDEVRDTIQHIGWVYSNGRETIIFLHYVGKPMAPIRVSYDVDEMVCRWHTRVWTLQEAALSKHRRYCIRMGTKAIGKCESLADILMNVRLWYEDESSNVEVVEEESFYDILELLNHNLLAIPKATVENQGFFILDMLWIWKKCISDLALTVRSTCFSFPTIDDALRQCVRRETKHKGDRINSILTLAGVKDFVAPKDSNVEASTLEFFEKQGQKGLARALFGINYKDDEVDFTSHELRRHKWLPMLGRSLVYDYIDGLENGMRLRVMGNGRLEMRPGVGDELLCYKVRIRVVKLPGVEIILEGAEAIKGVLQSLIHKGSGPTMLDMNLVLPAGTLFLSQAPSYPVGMLSMSLVAIDGSLCVVPSLINDRDQRLLEEEESFDAHLVTTSRCNSKRILLLYGNNILSSEVLKIGAFAPFYPSDFNELMVTLNIKPEKLIII